MEFNEFDILFWDLDKKELRELDDGSNDGGDGGDGTDGDTDQ
jgi:hypothetical protein